MLKLDTWIMAILPSTFTDSTFENKTIGLIFLMLTAGAWGALTAYFTPDEVDE